MGIGIAEIVSRGASASLLSWYRLFSLWVVTLLIRFILAAVDAYKAAFLKDSHGSITSPEYKQMIASFNRSSVRIQGDYKAQAATGGGREGDIKKGYHRSLKVRLPEKFSIMERLEESYAVQHLCQVCIAVATGLGAARKQSLRNGAGAAGSDCRRALAGIFHSYPVCGTCWAAMKSSG